MRESRSDRERPRMPPGQYVTQKWPVLTYGPTPRVAPANWDFKIFGQVEGERRLTYEEFKALPRIAVTADFHCVTTWSRLDNHWEGVSSAEIIALARPRAGVGFVLLHCDGGYITNVPMGELAADNVLFADRHDGADLAPEHGGPVRLVVPQLYAWKSAKWVRGIEFLRDDQPGFWELRGYHNHGDPWLEERYSLQEEAER